MIQPPLGQQVCVQKSYHEDKRHEDGGKEVRLRDSYLVRRELLVREAIAVGKLQLVLNRADLESLLSTAAGKCHVPPSSSVSLDKSGTFATEAF